MMTKSIQINDEGEMAENKFHRPAAQTTTHTHTHTSSSCDGRRQVLSDPLCALGVARFHFAAVLHRITFACHHKGLLHCAHCWLACASVNRIYVAPGVLNCMAEGDIGYAAQSFAN